MHKRVAALEGKSARGVTRWRQIIVDGQSRADALAAHEALHGAIGSDRVIYRVIVDPISVMAGGSVQ